MPYLSENWDCYEACGMSVYIHRYRSSWFVPNKEGDCVLKSENYNEISNHDILSARFISRIPDSCFREYTGRGDYITREKLGELWLHITDRCNLKCTHCLFSSSPESGGEIPFSKISGFVDEAYSLGCRLFVLTGGEPFVHAEIIEIIRYIISKSGSDVAVLTNGTLTGKMLEAKKLAPERIHFQISLDGLKENHDRTRGAGSFDRVLKTFDDFGKQGFAYTVSMCVTAENYAEMPGMVRFASTLSVKNLHFMWYFIKGRGDYKNFVDPLLILPYFIDSALEAERLSVRIDNITSLKSRIFSAQGTVHDGCGAAWETLAIGPDLNIYPTAATVGNKGLAASLENGIGQAWKNDPVMQKIRSATIASFDVPMKFLLGGGDFDHSWLASGRFIGADPYYEMNAGMALWLIGKEAGKYCREGHPALCLKMGDLLETCSEHGSVALCHSNCLLDLASDDVRSSVAKFYDSAAKSGNDEILNPVCYQPEFMDHIPGMYRFRGYGCGSPVMDAGIQDGYTVADLGSGRGIECFIAARLAGKNGKVTGVDMLDSMLEKAGEGAAAVARNLGFQNLDFRKGYLEDLPLSENSCDVIISNCVLNLSPDKRQVFAGIFRSLKPGGKLVASDVVCDDEPDPSVRNDEKLRGECIAGAMTVNDLTGILAESGFESIRLIRRFPYREVSGHPFYSLTFSASKPAFSEKIRAVYRGPFVSAVTDRGTVFHRGIIYGIDHYEAKALGDSIFMLDSDGAVENMVFDDSTCCCTPSPEESCCAPSGIKHDSGCMVCGSFLDYSKSFSEEAECYYCGKSEPASAVCINGHFVCDTCHMADGLEIIRRYLVATDERDMTLVFHKIRSHKSLPVHGPEHHALVAGIIVAAFNNMAGVKNNAMILEAVERGAKIAGGSCGFSGVCGAASGAGCGFSVLLGSTPVNPSARKAVQTVVHEILGEIAAFEAARCCQRDGWIALKKAAEISGRFLSFELAADFRIECTQYIDNPDCIGADCPLFVC